jgi:hypothetical protein
LKNETAPARRPEDALAFSSPRQEGEAKGFEANVSGAADQLQEIFAGLA